MTAQKTTTEITLNTRDPVLILSLPSLGIKHLLHFFVWEDLIGSQKQAFSSLILGDEFIMYPI
jgi:hypothetical protein